MYMLYLYIGRSVSSQALSWPIRGSDSDCVHMLGIRHCYNARGSQYLMCTHVCDDSDNGYHDNTAPGSVNMSSVHNQSQSYNCTLPLKKNHNTKTLGKECCSWYYNGFFAGYLDKQNFKK